MIDIVEHLQARLENAARAFEREMIHSHEIGCEVTVKFTAKGITVTIREADLPETGLDDSPEQEPIVANEPSEFSPPLVGSIDLDADVESDESVEDEQ